MLLFYLFLQIITPRSSCLEVTPKVWNFPTAIESFQWAGNHDAKSCDSECKDVCLKNNLGENCIHSCGCLLGNTILFVTIKNGHMYRSENQGRTWSEESEFLHSSYRKVAKENPELEKFRNIEDSFKVQEVYINQQNPSVVWVLGKGMLNWYSADGGESYNLWLVKDQEKQFRNVINILSHPTSDSSILIAVKGKDCDDLDDPVKDSPCSQDLFVSRNFTQSTKFLAKNVKQFSWAHSGRVLNRVVTRLHEHYNLGIVHGRANRLDGRNFYMLEYDIVTLVKDDEANSMEICMVGENILRCDLNDINVHSFHIFKHYIYKAKHVKGELKLSVSADYAQSFNPILFSDNKIPNIQSFRLWENKEGTVFLFVDKAEKDSATLFRSDFTGQRFTILLPSLHKCSNHQFEFFAMSSIDGIYLANSVVEVRKGNEVLEDIRTVITYDNGIKWHYLDAPRLDYLGDELECKLNEQCSLHLTFYSHSHLIPTVLSKENATGVIFALGFVGTKLDEEISNLYSYLSIDGGLVWTEVAQGPHFFAIGDHGGVMVMAHRADPVNTIKYSWNMGKTWQTLKISGETIKVLNVYSHPLSNSQEFFITGYYSEYPEDYTVIMVDFSELEQPQCKGQNIAGDDQSDYEIFVPHGFKGDKCILGRKTSYLRRKPERECYNGLDVDRIVKEEQCPCSFQDYECDFGYYRKTNGGPCEPISMRLFQMNYTKECNEAGHYLYTLGYRKIIGDSCLGGSQYDPTLQSCQKFIMGIRGDYIYWVVFSVMGILLAIYIHNKRLVLKYMIVKLQEQLFSKSVLTKEDIIIDPEEAESLDVEYEESRLV